MGTSILFIATYAVGLLLTLGTANTELQNCSRLNACLNPSWCSVMNEQAPETFVVEYGVRKLDRVGSRRGHIRIRVNRSWAPPYADRLWKIAKLGVSNGGPFYRVAANESSGFVVQFGLSGNIEVDECWDKNMWNNETWSVHSPGNVQWTVAFSMGATVGKPENPNPNCTSTSYCAQGFSQEIYINLGNNSHLDSNGFSIVGIVEDKMSKTTINHIYKGYGEVADLCTTPHPYCLYNKYGAPKGVNTTLLLQYGIGYIENHFPKMFLISKQQLTY
mmetsp:Transcript_8358/g.10041  ORF Transcript_8358/g.10041 Transcript_8358/m.10041 type:complete len:275 (-) Transcript_8358:257-1081(-)